MWIISASADGNSKTISRHSLQKDLVVLPYNSFSALFNVVVVFVVLVVAGRIGDWSTRGRNGILTRVITPGVTH
jgi:hypothetical protein